MGNSSQKRSLIDFLYRDISRIDSFFAQLFQGTIKEIAASSSSSNSKSSQVEGNIQVVKGGTESEEIITNSLEKHIDPHDQKILDILGALNISVHDSISNVNNGQIVLLKGSIVIRNYQTIKQAIPLLFKIGPETFVGNKNRKEIQKEIKKNSKIIESILNLIPMGLELEIHTDKNETLSGILVPEYLSQNPNDLLRLYGNNMPGEWHVLGIVDSLNYSTKCNYSSDIKKSTDEFAEVIKSMFNEEESNYRITPILIYRKIIY